MRLSPVLELSKGNCGGNVKGYDREGMGEIFSILLYATTMSSMLPCQCSHQE
jgi:hypothetical protein